jgi:hypothetical protein
MRKESVQVQGLPKRALICEPDTGQSIHIITFGDQAMRGFDRKDTSGRAVVWSSQTYAVAILDGSRALRTRPSCVLVKIEGREKILVPCGLMRPQ